MLANLAESSSTLGKMADISKEQLRKEITAILKNADLTKTSGKQVRQQLEEKLDVDLAEQKKVVDKLVLEVIKEQQAENESDEDENGDHDDDEEEDSDDQKKKKKAPKRAAPKKKADSDSEAASDDDADDKDDDYTPKKKAKGAAKKGGKKGKKKGSESESDEDWGKNKKKRGGGGGAKKGAGQGYIRPYTLSPELAKLMGQDSMPRHEVVKRVWAIIKERNLYDPKNKQFAICDDDLMKVFNVKRFRTFGMMKYLKDHFKS